MKNKSKRNVEVIATIDVSHISPTLSPLNSNQVENSVFMRRKFTFHLRGDFKK